MQILIGILIGILFNILFVGVYYAGFKHGQKSKVTKTEKVEVPENEKIKRIF